MAGGGSTEAVADEGKVQQELQTLEAELPAEEATSDSGKLKQLMTVLKKTIGVKDLASLRLSLPASLIHPEGNLEYWHYLDRPDLFAAIDVDDDELQRMLAIIRWALSFNLRHVKGKVVKPYNSVLGEQFRAIWDVEPPEVPRSGSTLKPTFKQHIDTSAPGSGSAAASSTNLAATTNPSSSASSFKSFAASSSSSLASAKSAQPAASNSNPSGATAPPSTASPEETEPENPGEPMPKPDRCARVVFLNEQVSHHPPISSFWYEALPPAGGKRVQAYGVDQMSAKFTGTSVRLYAGDQNYGVYVNLPDRNNEEWHITHPTGNITGFLRGSLYATISDTSFITCKGPSGKQEKGKTAVRAILNYPDESWIKGARYVVEGVVYKYEVGSESENFTKIKQVPDSAVLGTIEGSWRGKVNWKPKGSKQSLLLIDLSELLPVPKMVRPIAVQHKYESRRLWQPVTEAILTKQYNAATRNKQVIEQKQRDIATELAKKNEEHPVELFDDAARLESGRSALNARGRQILEEELKGLGYATDYDATEARLKQLALSDGS